jgi:hypothetical protein
MLSWCYVIGRVSGGLTIGEEREKKIRERITYRKSNKNSAGLQQMLKILPSC